MPLPPGVGPFNIEPGQTVGSYLDSVIERMLKEGPKAKLQQAALYEKEKQQGGGEEDLDLDTGDEGGDESGGLGDALAGDAEGADDLGGDMETPASPDTAEIGRQMGGPQKKVASDDVEALKTVPELGDIVDKLNAVRSGKSLKDEDIRGAFEKYVGGLDAEEKIALFAFLKGIAQVTSGEVSGEEAVEPDTAPTPGIEMKKSDEPGPSADPSGQTQQQGDKKVRSIKPNVVGKRDNPESPYVGDEPAEDTTGPMPVQAKRRG